jgi:signal transduction histidine kinase
LKEVNKIRAVVAELDSVSTSEASSVLRTSAADAIGPLSKKLWNSAKDSYPKIRIRDVVSHAVHTQPFRPLVLSILVVCLSVMDRVARLGTQTGLLMTAFIVAMVSVQLDFANRAMLRWVHIRARIFVGAIALIELLTIGIVVWERHLMNAPVSYVEICISVSASIFLFFVSIGLRSVDLMRGVIASFVMNDIREEKIASIARDRQISSVVREMARELHGTVQTRLVSCALALDLAAEAGDSESANAALLEARRILEPNTSGLAIGILSVSAEVDRRVSVWNALCDCAVEIDVFDDYLACAQILGRVVEEGITNAVRHGQSSFVRISIKQLSDDVVRVVVTDNGTGPSGGRRGLGSSILDSTSGGDWSLKANNPGAVLTVMVRCGSAR